MGHIRYDESTRVFILETKNSTYQMMVGQHNTLLHLYYGANAGDTEVTYRIIG